MDRDKHGDSVRTERERMGTSPPAWQAHHATNYDSTMTGRCSTLLAEIISDPARRSQILADPRDLHRELFASFVPQGHDDYAGTYRGTPNTALADRKIFADSLIQPGKHYEFCRPDEVPARMNQLMEQTRQWLTNAEIGDYAKLLGLTYTFCWFGKIHPFLDGNGHVQRAIFAAMVAEYGYPLSPRFVIHPRPFDRLLATALELFSCAPAGKEDEELPLVAEYLGFFLDGPFNGPRKHVQTATPYS
jgi:fido (protein-threonine AMPylation protein)